MPSAAEEGWVKSLDSRTGRVYYANRHTRETQWEPPFGWIDEPSSNNGSDLNSNYDQSNHFANSNLTGSSTIKNQNDSQHTINKRETLSISLPKNWEMMRDHKTGRPFYIDHVNKVTTWDPPPNTKANTARENMYKRRTSSLSETSWKLSNPSKSAYSSNSFEYENKNERSFGGNIIPPLEFSVVSIKDEARTTCPNCNVFFSIPLKRRHHCRLCGDVFCDACTYNRCLLPMDGAEYEKPVRVCDLCFSDVQNGNYFSMRRYLAPLQLFDSNKAFTAAITNSLESKTDGHDIDAGVTETQVCAALAALASDLDAVLLDATSFHEKITIPAETLVPAITRHLDYGGTSDRAICALSTLLALGKIVGDYSFALAIFKQDQRDEGSEQVGGGKTKVMDSILKLLEQSGSSRHVLFFQEQAARSIFYLSDVDVIPPEDKTLDLHRALRNMLDHATCSTSSSLQRWAAACIRNLIIQDQLRTSLYSNSEMKYESFTSELVTSGGVIILCSLIAAEDPDTRAHAIYALSAVISAARELKQNEIDANLVTAISSSGGCGEAISQLLLSSDLNVAHMSLSFASNLVAPLLGYKRAPVLFPSESTLESRIQSMKPYRDAAIALVKEGDCLPALTQLISQTSYQKKSIMLDIKLKAMSTLASIAIACNTTTKPPSHSIMEVTSKLMSISAVPAAFDILSSMSTQSLNSGRDSPHIQLREAAGLFIGQMLLLDDTNHVLNYLRDNRASIVFFTLVGDDGMFQPSGLQGDWAPRCLPWLETAALLLTKVWYKGQSLLVKSSMNSQAKTFNSNSTNTGFDANTLDCLLEVIDAGAVQILSDILSRENESKTVGNKYLEIAACHTIAAMFGLAHGDVTNIGTTRLFDAVQFASSTMKNRFQKRSVNNLITLTLSFLHSVIRKAHNHDGEEIEMPFHALSVAALMATGSVCGTFTGCNTTNSNLLDSNALALNFHGFTSQDEFKSKKENICVNAASLLLGNSNAFPSMLVGVYGKESIEPALRLVLVIALYGSVEVRAKLATCIVPVYDILKQSLFDGDRYTFTSAIAVIKYCGPHVTADTGANRELLNALHCAVKTLASVLSVTDSGYDHDVQFEKLRFLKESCIFTLEALSSNKALWASIATDAFGPITEYLSANDCWDEEDSHKRKILCSVINTVKNVITLPSHAVAACDVGIASPLSRLVCGKRDIEDDIDKRTREGRRKALQKEKIRRENKIEFDVKISSLEVLHNLASNKEARISGTGLISAGAIAAACFSLGGNTEMGDTSSFQDSQRSGYTTKIGLEILHFLFSDLENPTMGNDNTLLWSAQSKLFVDKIARQSRFIRALCATMLLSSKDLGYGLNSEPGLHTSYKSSNDDDFFEVAPLYGPPLITYDDDCAGYPDSIEASVAILFSIASLCSSVDASFSEAFWDSFMIKEHRALINEGSKKEASVTACSVFLSILMDDEEGICVPQNPENEQFFLSYSLPLVRERLLHGLCSSFSGAFNSDELSVSEDDAALLAILKRFGVQSMCMTLCGTSPSFIEPAFHLIKGMTSSFPDEILPDLVKDETSLRAALDMLYYQNDEDENGSGAQIRLLFAKIICASATKGILGPSLERFNLRSRAIASLSAACKMGTHDTSHFCLQSLAISFTGKLQLSPVEARTLAKSLGGIISSMVLERFAKRTNDQTNIHATMNEEPMEKAPEVILLCSLASFKEALSELCHVGGLEAISLVSSDGVPSAILAMHEVVKDDPNVIIDIEGHISVMDVLNADSEKKYTVGHNMDDVKRFRKSKVSFEFLTALCKSSALGRKAISSSSSCSSCIATASNIICSLSEKYGGKLNDTLLIERESKVNFESHDEISSKNLIKNKEGKQRNQDKKMAAIAAIAFLSELLHIEASREIILNDSKLLQFLVFLGKHFSDMDIVGHSTELLKSLAFYSNRDRPSSHVSPSFFVSTFCEILCRNDFLKNTITKQPAPLVNFTQNTTPDTRNLVYASAAAGLTCVFSDTEQSEKLRVIDCVSYHFSRLTAEFSKTIFVKNTRSNCNKNGLLAFNMSTLLLMSRYEDPYSTTLMKSDLLSSLFKYIILHEINVKKIACIKKSSKDDIDANEICLLSAACTQILQFISSITRNDKLQNMSQFSLKEIISNVDVFFEERIAELINLRQVSSIKSEFELNWSVILALDLISKNKNDSAASIYALNVKEKLGWYA